MFGYVMTNSDELKIKDYRRYQAYYCGVCKSLKKQYGIPAQMTLTYDMSFLGLVLTALYEDETEPKKVACIAHPFTKHEALMNAYTEYAAAMNLLLAYYKCEDDWTDERKLGKKCAAGILHGNVKKAQKKYPRQAEAISQYIEAQKQAEASAVNDQPNQTEPTMSIDSIASVTGEMLGKLFCYQEDMWSAQLYRMGFFLGKFIYVMDAFDDLEKDEKKGNFNPLLAGKDEPDFESRIKEMLTDLAAESARAFENLPILKDAEIIRNILYSGLWTRYEQILVKRHKVVLENRGI